MKPRPQILEGMTIKTKVSCGTIFVTVNFDEDKNPVEVFAYLGKSGSCSLCNINSLCRVISIALRNGAPAHDIIEHLEGMRCSSPTYHEGQQYLSCADAIAKSMKEVLSLKSNQ